jgi:alpha-glucosidase (family GH31 glycosyl hydrolase)
LVDATNEQALKTTFDYWHDGYGKYGIKAMWMDESGECVLRWTRAVGVF